MGPPVQPVLCQNQVNVTKSLKPKSLYHFCNFQFSIRHLPVTRQLLQSNNFGIFRFFTAFFDRPPPAAIQSPTRHPPRFVCVSTFISLYLISPCLVAGFECISKCIWDEVLMLSCLSLCHCFVIWVRISFWFCEDVFVLLLSNCSIKCHN
ncbi:hypothetical protein Patl1_26711 [Pistacia atlantica]|uniref:Uncharacterized protein n=1 Tax=Pistacia atlantica TaxID=434234 RepID=A0ACC1AZ12_9ROSI|nr:hypothetical protein Patl1_26711 [Pistacia atlantica]